MAYGVLRTNSIQRAASRSLQSQRHDGREALALYRHRAEELVAVEFAGLRELDIHRLLQIADRLDVNLDWLLGRTGQRRIQP